MAWRSCCPWSIQVEENKALKSELEQVANELLCQARLRCGNTAEVARSLSWISELETGGRYSDRGVPDGGLGLNSAVS